jgi:hypothetical protein
LLNKIYPKKEMSYLPGVLKLLAIIHFSENPKKISYQTIEDYLSENNVNMGGGK